MANHPFCKKVYLKADYRSCKGLEIFLHHMQLYVIWLISVIQRTSSWQTWDSHGVFNFFLIYIFMCTICIIFHLYYLEFIYVCSNFLYSWNDFVALCSRCDLLLLKTLVFLSFHVKKPCHWIHWFVDSISPIIENLHSFQPTYTKIKLIFKES